MGLPEIIIEFKAKAETAIARSENGVVAVILADNSKTGDEYASYSYNYEADIVSAHWTATNKDYLNKVFMGNPRKVLVERVAAGDDYAESLTNALARLANKKWNWLAIPGIAAATVNTIKDWIIAQRAAKKTFKAVLPDCSANNEGIVNFATSGIKVGSKTYTAAEYTARIAGLLAGLPLTESATYQALAEISGITESVTPDADIDAGKFILINDGEKIKVGRGINSLATLSGDKTEDLKKIKIIEGMDLMRDDIRDSFENNYIGINNSYDNKVMFVSAVNQYLKGLVREGVLYSEGTNTAEIDVAAQRDWLAQKYDVSELTDDEIKKAKTGSHVFVTATIAFSDAIEDLHFSISME